ncbi:MAG: hypothetical protein LBR70_04835 [Lactobacillaceae bacterium]|jgi:hypothetical protein|nr:hypothetical protein [Lactobacillaceae bacterium]
MYKNELKDNAKIKAAIEKEKSRHFDDVVFCYPDYIIPDSAVPANIKEEDCQINREFLFLKVKYDEILKRSVFIDIRIGKEINPSHISGGGAYGKNIDIKDIILVMDRDDYNKAKINSENIMGIPMEEREAFAAKLSKRENDLAFTYFYYVNIEARQKPYHFAHEAHHLSANLKIAEREKTNGALNAEDYYKSCEDSEKSAYFAEILKVVEAYHKGGDYNSFKAFPGTRYNWLKNKLKETSLEDRKAFVMDMDYLINGSAENWNEFSGGEFYRAEGGQFEAKTKGYAELNGEVKNKDTNKEYEAYKSIYFTYDIYNPDTCGYEEKDLSPKIKDNTGLNARAERFLHILKINARKKEMSENHDSANGFDDGLVISEEPARKPQSGVSFIKNIFSAKGKKENL